MEIDGNIDLNNTDYYNNNLQRIVAFIDNNILIKNN